MVRRTLFTASITGTRCAPRRSSAVHSTCLLSGATARVLCQLKLFTARIASVIAMSFWSRLARAVAPSLIKEATKQLNNRASGGQRNDSPARPHQTSTPRKNSAPRGRDTAPQPSPVAGYPGDFHGIPDMVYQPNRDGQPDPGEVVWTWVPFEEDYSQGEDRPVLLIGHDGEWLLGLPLTSKDHDRDAAQEARAGRQWLDVGSGPWDRQGRPSEVRVNRILRVDPNGVRREGAQFDRAMFERVAEAVRQAN